MERERKLSWILSLLHLSSHFSSPTPLLCLTSVQTPAALMLAPLQQLSGWFHSDATQTPLIIFFVISSCFLSESEAPSLTSTPTHLQNGHPAPALLKMFLWHRLGLGSISSSAAPFPSARLASTSTLLWYGYDSTLALNPFWLHASCPPTLSFDSSLLLSLRPKRVLFPI